MSTKNLHKTSKAHTIRKIVSTLPQTQRQL